METTDRRLPYPLVLLIGSIGGPLLAFVIVWFCFPWIPVELTSASNGYTVAGCWNEPRFYLKGSVYDCFSSTRQRYNRYIEELK